VSEGLAQGPYTVTSSWEAQADTVVVQVPILDKRRRVTLVIFVVTLSLARTCESFMWTAGVIILWNAFCMGNYIYIFIHQFFLLLAFALILSLHLPFFVAEVCTQLCSFSLSLGEAVLTATMASLFQRRHLC